MVLLLSLVSMSMLANDKVRIESCTFPPWISYSPRFSHHKTVAPPPPRCSSRKMQDLVYMSLLPWLLYNWPASSVNSISKMHPKSTCLCMVSAEPLRPGHHHPLPLQHPQCLPGHTPRPLQSVSIEMCLFFLRCELDLVPFLLGASLMAQLVKNLPAVQETPVWFLSQEDPLEKG